MAKKELTKKEQEAKNKKQRERRAAKNEEREAAGKSIKVPKGKKEKKTRRKRDGDKGKQRKTSSRSKGLLQDALHLEAVAEKLRNMALVLDQL